MTGMPSVQQAVMFCTNCGKQVSDSAMQCEFCDASLSASRQVGVVQATPSIAQTTSASLADQPTASLPSSPGDSGDSLKGRVLGGRYQLDSCIGSGGMGAIYKARRLHIGDTVAVKVLRPEVVNDSLSRERFHREARAAAMLNHPNAVVIHDFGEDADGTAYIVMELLEGHSLRQILNEQKTMPPERTYGVLRQACAALESAHRRGIIHRDIKPDNIILTNSEDLTDHVKILDFGIAKLRDKAVDTASLEKSLTTVGTVIGTPHYMSPEQCQGEPADARSDIYSLGVVIYEMLTGAVPFTAKTPTGVAVKHVTEPPKPLSNTLPGIAAALDKVVMRALAKNAADRQQSALELAREFEAALNPGRTSSQSVVATQEIRTAEAATRVMSQVPDTSTSQSVNNRSFETQITPARTADNKKPFPVTAVALAALLIILIGISAFLLVRARNKRVVVVAPTPTTIPEVSPSLATPTPPPTPAMPVPPEGMAYIPGGDFRLGRNDGTDEYDRPSSQATVKAFFMDITEVTNEQYQKFVDENNATPPPSWKDQKFLAGTEKLPVTEVSWEDATAYAGWAGKRLPTEEEWEFAARGPDNRLYPWGMEWQPGFSNVTEPDGGKKKLAPVGSFAQGVSPFKVLDLSGNAWEWTASELKAYPGGTLPVQPEGYRNLKVIRGGSYDVPPERATATFRRGWPASRQDWPEGKKPDYSQTGFRCVQDAP